MATDSIAIIKAVFPANAQLYGLRDTQIQADIKSGYISKYTSARPQDCAQAAGYTPDGTAITSKAGAALGTAVAGYGIASKALAFLAPIPVVGQIIAGIAAIALPFIGGLFKHHAQAVAREQGTLCAAVPRFDAELQAIDSEIQKGTISAAQADASVDQAVQSFDDAVAGISQGTSGQGTCNAGCVMQAEVKAVGEVHKQEYHNSLLYYLKHYWWVGAIVLAYWLFFEHRVVVKGG